MVDRKKLETLYNRYKDPSEPEKIGMEGVVRFLEDLNLDPTSRLGEIRVRMNVINFNLLFRSVLIIAWKFKAQQQCEFSREEFIGGMVELGRLDFGQSCL